MAHYKLGFLLLLSSLGLVGCDHATKAVAKASLATGPQTLVPGVLDLRYAENHDSAFSLFRAAGVAPSMGLLIFLASIALVSVGILMWRRRKVASPIELAGYVAVLGGALGNVTDRIVRGYVVDFIHLHHWPIFNVADILVVVGAGLLLLASRAEAKRERPARRASS